MTNILLPLTLATAPMIPADDIEQPVDVQSHANTTGEEDEEISGPILLEAAYTGEAMANVSGGVRRGTQYLDNFDLVMEADLEQLLGWRGATAQIYGLYNNGRSISDLAGDAQAVSNIETGISAVRLYEAWIQQDFGDNLSVRTGLYDLNSEFDALDAAGLFVSSPHGIGTDFAQSGENGPSIFPFTSLAARVEFKPADGWALRAAILDGVPGDPSSPKSTVIELGGGDGALTVAELQAPLENGKVLLGYWRYTGEFDRIDNGAKQDGNAGMYVRGESTVHDDGERSISTFARVGTADARFNRFSLFTSAGVKFAGWVKGRETDEFGIAIASAITSDRYRLLTGAANAETAIEVTYRSQLTPHLALQPSVHYVHRPSADPTVPAALLFGLRAEVSFNLLGN